MEATQRSTRRAGRPKAKELVQRAEDLLAITQSLLLKFGYERTTLNLIAKEAGVSKQTIYAKYGGKPGLMRAVLQGMSDQSLRQSLAADDGLCLYEGLLHRVRKMIATLRSANSLGLVMISIREWTNFPDIRDDMIRSREKYLLEPMVEYLEHLKSCGIVKDIDCTRVASMLIWSVSEELLEVATTGQLPEASDQELDDRAAFIAGFYRDAIVREQAP